MQDDWTPVRVYAWGQSWTEVDYGKLDWPSYSSRYWFFEPWPLFLR